MRHRSIEPVPETGVGSVSFTEVMTMREFGRRLGLGPRGLCDAQRQGLRTILFGRTKYVWVKMLLLGFVSLPKSNKVRGETMRLLGRLAN